MTYIKEIMKKIKIQAWIIGGVIILGLILAIIFNPISFLKNKISKEVVLNKETENFIKDATDEIFTKDNVLNGQYKNDISSATLYVQNTKEVEVAVVVSKEDAKLLSNVQKTSCGYITYVKTRVPYPAILTNTITKLFENKVDTDFLPGNIIPTLHPELTLENVVLENGIAKIYLGGNFGSATDGWCDANLAITQIIETTKTFDTIEEVEVYQDGKKIN